jgi:hypothetical protein
MPLTRCCGQLGEPVMNVDHRQLVEIKQVEQYAISCENLKLGTMFFEVTVMRNQLI